MATIGYTVGSVFTFPGGQALHSAVPSIDEAITSSGASAQSSGTVGNNPMQVATVTVPEGASIWIAFGTNPTAAAGVSHLRGPGVWEFANLQPGWKCAVIDA